GSVKQLQEMIKRKNRFMAQMIEKKALKLSSLMDQLSLLNPMHIMKRGFAIPYTSDHTLVKSIQQVEKNDQHTVYATDARINCEVVTAEEETRNEYSGTTYIRRSEG